MKTIPGPLSENEDARGRLGVHVIFFHPDYTVGSGIAPDRPCGSWAVTTGGESHPALKMPASIPEAPEARKGAGARRRNRRPNRRDRRGRSLPPIAREAVDGSLHARGKARRKEGGASTKLG